MYDFHSDAGMTKGDWIFECVVIWALTIATIGILAVYIFNL